MMARGVLAILLVATTGMAPSTEGASARTRRMREDDASHFLGSLEIRCKKMHDMQLAVYARTKSLDANSGKPPHARDRHAARRLARQEKLIIAEVDKAIAQLEREGAALAFPEVFREVRKDLSRVQARLEAGDVGRANQAIQKDIIDTFDEMVRALK